MKPKPEPEQIQKKNGCPKRKKETQQCLVHTALAAVRSNSLRAPSFLGTCFCCLTVPPRVARSWFSDMAQHAFADVAARRPRTHAFADVAARRPRMHVCAFMHKHTTFYETHEMRFQFRNHFFSYRGSLEKLVWPNCWWFLEFSEISRNLTRSNSLANSYRKNTWFLNWKCIRGFRIGFRRQTWLDRTSWDLTHLS